MTWICFAMIVVAGFALLKVRRRRQGEGRAGSGYSDSKAA